MNFGSFPGVVASDAAFNELPTTRFDLDGGDVTELLRLDASPGPLLTPLGHLIGEPGFGPLSAALISFGEGATFGISEVRWSLFPLAGSTVRLRRQVPYTKAMEMLLTGDHYPAAEALRMGLIGRVVPDGQALATAREMAVRVAANGPLAVQGIKRSVQETEALPEREALALELEIGMGVVVSEDAREGPRAFLEKRPPRFKGR